MTISDWLVIFAILAAPIVALQIQKYIEDRKEIRARKMQIFRALMATRATRLNPKHIEALNMIDIEFFKNKKITKAWKLLLDNFVNFPKDTKDPNYQVQLNSCVEKSDDLFINLLYEMAKSLNYTFDEVHLKRGVYIPKGQADYIMDQEFIRRAFVDVLSGQRPIPIKVVNMSSEGAESRSSKTETNINQKNKNT